ncbi:MAG: SH3 domain-containing protein [Anaerolineaceae bacterium]|nr:SH3 domain-containing protein [Anaerolineaceae bacterium]
MRTGLLLPVLVLLLVATATYAQEAEPVWLEVADVALRLREGPSGDDVIITQLTPREAVVLLERGEAWSQVRRQDGMAGWAHNDYLLPWDERNRPDTWRRVGDRRLFRVFGGSRCNDPIPPYTVDRYADLRVVSEHSYIYTVGRDSSAVLPSEQALQEYGQAFDERIYHQALDLWRIEDPPHIEGDERVVILIAAGFGTPGASSGWYVGRSGMPHEANPSGTGYLGIEQTIWEERWADVVLESRSLQVLAHEFGHLLHHHVGQGNHMSWVNEGFAEFTEKYLDRDLTLLDRGMSRMEQGAHDPGTNQLNHPSTPSYINSMYFMTYIYEQLGMDTLRSFVNHPQQGLAALDTLLDERGDGRDADDFFTDWVIANYLNEAQLEGGRYGYQLFRHSTLLQQTLRSTPLQQLPARISDHAEPYSSKYYELSDPQGLGPDRRLLLGFQLSGPVTQDAWLQVVQVLPERIDVQRFRASDYRRRPAVPTLLEQPERIFIAVSPFTPGARQRTQSAYYSLNLDEVPLSTDTRAWTTANLMVRSAPQIADNSLGVLRLCSIVQVLKSEGDWSLIEDEGGLIGWSYNRHLTILDDAGSFSFEGSCDTGTRGAGGGAGGSA